MVQPGVGQEMERASIFELLAPRLWGNCPEPNGRYSCVELSRRAQSCLLTICANHIGILLERGWHVHTAGQPRLSIQTRQSRKLIIMMSSGLELILAPRTNKYATAERRHCLPESLHPGPWGRYMSTTRGMFDPYSVQRLRGRRSFDFNQETAEINVFPLQNK